MGKHDTPGGGDAPREEGKWDKPIPKNPPPPPPKPDKR